jgi:hypothetical protein
MPRFAFIPMLILACALSLAPARAADDAYTVSAIAVDATAASASVAQNIAINEGRGRAWTALFRRLTKAQDWPRQPALDVAALQRLILNYQAANERRSTTRYVATMTYVFNPDAVKHLLRSQNIPYVDTEARPVMVVAMAPSYGAHSAWAQIWANPKYATGGVPIVSPVGDLLDTQALGALNFATAQWPDVEPAASRVHASDVFLVQATPSRGAIVVALRRLGPTPSPPLANISVPVKPGEPAAQAYAAAADAAATAIAEFWKAHSAIDFSKRLKLTANVRIASRAEWGVLMQKLAAIPVITDVSVQAMTISDARLAITYAGSTEQLSEFAAQSNVILTAVDGTWQLSLAGASGPAAAPP